MKSVFFITLLAAVGYAQVTRDNDGYSTTTEEDSHGHHDSTSSDSVSASKTAQQYPAYSAPTTAANYATESNDGYASSAWSSGWTSSWATTYTPASGAWSASQTSAPTGSYTYTTESPFSFGGSSSSATVKTSASKTSSTAAASPFTGGANTREIAFGFGAAAAGFAMLL